jgi:ATP-binding cassette subfamily A (ABC1) protein 3
MLISFRNIIASANHLDINNDNVYSMDLAGPDLLFLVGSIFFYWTLVILFEKRVFKCMEDNTGNITDEKDNVKLDDDVEDEIARVAQTNPKDSQIHLENLRKIYTDESGKKIAVRNVCFSLDNGECFALLGVNGAGKTTTFKSLTAEVIPTTGKTFVRGLNV